MRATVFSCILGRMDIAEKIKQTIEDALQNLGISGDGVVLEHPTDTLHGDFATNAAMVAAKGCGKNPRECAELLLQHIERNKPEEVDSVNIAGPGFINFHLSREFFVEMTSHVLKEGDTWGRSERLKGKKIMVEYTDPNPFKIFHIGHLMSNAIGESIARLIEFSGAEVRRANYQGDVGLHVAKAIAGFSFKPFEDRFVKLDKTGGAIGDKVRLLNEMYAYGALNYHSEEEGGVKELVDKINKEVYEDQMNDMVKYVYKTGKQWSLEAFDLIYKKLGTTFDYSFFESETWKEGKEIAETHSDIFEKSDGAIVFHAEKYDNKLHTRVFVNSEGLPTYEAKDLGLVKLKLDKYPFDKSVTITASEQTEYFKVVKKAMELVYPELAEKIIHISHGMMRLPSGKMSSRTGDVIAAEDLMHDVTEAVLAIESDRELQNKDETAQLIMIGALKYWILKQTAGKDIVFDVNRALSFEGDSGPYLQYAHTRAESILKKTNSRVNSGVNSRVNETTLLEKLIYRFPEVVARAQNEYEPHYVVTYLTELAAAFNALYAAEKFIGGGDEVYRLALTRAFQITMKNGLYLLGITAPVEM